jgi:hypothetical protein
MLRPCIDSGFFLRIEFVPLINADYASARTGQVSKHSLYDLQANPEPLHSSCDGPA